MVEYTDIPLFLCYFYWLRIGDMLLATLMLRVIRNRASKLILKTEHIVDSAKVVVNKKIQHGGTTFTLAPIF